MKVIVHNHRSKQGEWFALPINHHGELRTLREQCGTSALHVLVALAASADEDGVVDITLTELAEVAGYSQGVVDDAIHGLEQAGYIEVIERTYYARREMSEVVRWQVFKRDGYKCVYCGKNDGPFEIDHVIPVSKGGRDNMKNLVTACPRCNRKKSNKVVNND